MFDFFCAKPITDYLIFDHITVLSDPELEKPPPKLKQMSYRKIKEVDKEKLLEELLSSELY